MSTEEVSIAPHILLVEDNAGDILLVKESLRGVRTAYQLSIARDGEQALDFMRSTLADPALSKPDLILLDLNLPKVSGYEVLAQLKRMVEFQQIPILVLSSSSAPEDIVKAYALAANCYLCKPAGLDEFFQMMHSLLDFWLKMARFPRANSHSISA